MVRSGFVARPQELPKTSGTFGEAARVDYQAAQFSPRIRATRIDKHCFTIGIFGVREVSRFAEGIALAYQVERGRAFNQTSGMLWHVLIAACS